MNPFTDGERAAVRDAVLSWFDAHARDLPWRRPDATAWGVMVSEFMLQQTPVSRVLGPWAAWLERWSTPAALAAASTGEAVEAWGRLGYPRRALRLHAAATAITEQHGGQVPDGIDELRALPGVGDYTAAAIASFAFGGSHVVLDTNVRRVLGRIEAGQALPGASVTRAERERAEHWLPADGTAARWAAASMELGALVCTATTPRCDDCPVARHCRWLAAGSPSTTAPRRTQAWEGTDRQARGMILQALRETDPLTGTELVAEVRRRGFDRADRVPALLTDLTAEGLIHQVPGGYSLHQHRD